MPDIYAVWENEGWSQPIVEEQYGPDRTILTLPLVKKPPIKTADKKLPSTKMLTQIEQILENMQKGKEYKAAEIGEMLDLKESRTKEILRYMVSERMISIIGNNRNRRYIKNG